MALIKHRAVLYQCNRLTEKLNASYKGKLPPPLAGPCVELVRNMGLLSQSWSVMAGRNLMSDILRSLALLEPQLSGELKSACAEAKAQVNKLLQGHNITAARYDSVLCLGYKVKTAGDSFAGKTDDWADMKERCDDMKTAIAAAYTLAETQGKYNSVPTMLKIFMAPEFFFRGRNGAYEHSVIGGEEARTDASGKKAPARAGLIQLLEDEIGDKKYKDWLFVLGTVIAATRSSRTVCKDCGADVKYVRDGSTGKTKPVCTKNDKHLSVKEEDVGASVDNIAFVWKEKELYTVSKELVSHIDFVTDTSKGITNKVNVQNETLDVKRTLQKSGYSAADGKPSAFQDERMGGSIFTINGVTFGLEVCLDHAASTGSASAGRLENAANIQVQLIPSAGMGLTALRTVPDGIVFNVDGGAPHVQVVGGKSGEVRYDLADDTGTDFELQYPSGLKWSKNLNMDDLVKTTPLPSWKVLTGAPVTPVAGGASGSVLLYGPYDLP